MDEATLKQEALAMGLIETTKGALTPQQKVLAANALIFKQTADAQGDFARTSDGVANQQRILEATFKDLQTEIGQKLLPTFNSALTSLNEFLGDLDAEDVLSFAKALGIAAAGFAGFKFGQLVQGLAATIKGMKGATLSVQGLSKAVAANPFGLIASSVAALVAYGPDILDMLNGVNEAQMELDEIAYKATENLRKEQAELNLVGEALAKTNPGSEERARLLQRFNELSPQGIADLKDTFDLNNQLATAMASANAQYDNRIKKIGLEAAATAAAQKQIELKAKITAEEDRLVQETGMSYDEVRKSVQEYIEYQKTGAFPAFARAKNLLRGGVGDLAQLQYAYDQTTQQTQRIKAETDAFNTSMNKNSVMANKSNSGFSFLSGTLSKFGQKVEETKAKWSMFQGAVSSGVSGGEGDEGGDGGEQERISEERAKKLKEIQAQFNKEMMSLADELTLMMIADEDERAKKQLEIQKRNDLASIDASEFNAKEKAELKAKIDKKYNQLEIDRQKAQNEKIKKLEQEVIDFIQSAKDEQHQDELTAAKEDLAFANSIIEKSKTLSLKDVDEQEERFNKIAAAGLFSEEQLLLARQTFAKMREEVSNQEASKAQESIAKTQETFSQIAGAVTSVTGPAFAAINALYDANLQRLENEKNKRLANENLTAEERLRIEEEYEKKKNEMMAEQFEVNRVSQIIQATMSAAQAALNAFTSTALLFAPAAPAAAAAAGAFGALQIGIIAAQPNPYKFYDGTPYLQLGDNPKGRDTIPVMAHEGEAIIPTRNNLQYPGLAKSWIDGNLDRYINNNFVRPALMEQQKQAEEEFADRLAASMALQMAANFDDYRLHRDLKEQTAVLRDGFHSMKTTRKKLRGA
jgi:hypothetical protein